MYFIYIFLFLTVNAQAKISFNPKLLKITDQCAKTEGAQAHVYVIKQWHLSPNANTKEHPNESIYPQQKNQTEIYEQLLEWSQKKEVGAFLAEGCEKEEIDFNFKPIFNGWSILDLKDKSSTKSYQQVLSHVILKLKAKQGNNVKTYCSDNLNEMKKSELLLSDARGDVGYLTRLTELKDQPEKVKIYLEGAIEVLKLSKSSSTQDAIHALGLDLKRSLKGFQESTHERNVTFANQAIKLKSDKPLVLVVGGMHAEDLKKVFEDKKINCTIFEPIHYQNSDEALNQSLQKLIEKY